LSLLPFRSEKTAAEFGLDELSAWELTDCAPCPEKESADGTEQNTAAASVSNADVSLSSLRAADEEDVFSIIDVCSSRQLFDTFRGELLRATSFSFALAVDREKTPPAAAEVVSLPSFDSRTTDAGPLPSIPSRPLGQEGTTNDVCRVDSGVVGKAFCGYGLYVQSLFYVPVVW
jgi:hypothetical protein